MFRARTIAMLAIMFSAFLPACSQPPEGPLPEVPIEVRYKGEEPLYVACPALASPSMSVHYWYEGEGIVVVKGYRGGWCELEWEKPTQIVIEEMNDEWGISATAQCITKKLDNGALYSHCEITPPYDAVSGVLFFHV